MRAFFCMLAVLNVLAGTSSSHGQFLRFVEPIDDEDLGTVGLANPENVTTSPDGRHLYVAVSGPPDGIVVLSIGPEGSLTHVQTVNDDNVFFTSNSIPGIAISPDGRWVFFSGASTTTRAVSTWERSVADGTLSFVEAIFDDLGPFDFGRPVDIAVSPDSRFLYVAGSEGPAGASVTVLEPSPITGFFSQVEVVEGGTAAAPDLEAAYSLTVSPGGQHLYVVGQPAVDEGSVTLFERDGTFGSLTYVETVAEGQGDIVGLGMQGTIGMSFDGESLYVASERNDSLAVFSRDLVDGRLAFVEAQFELLAGVRGLDRASDVLVSPRGDLVFVTGIADNTLAMFGRDQANGELSILEVEFNGSDGVDGLINPMAVALSADGGHVYTVGPTFAGFGGRKGIMSHFEVGLFADGFESGDLFAWSSSP